MARKTYNEKLNNSNDLPKIVDISNQEDFSRRYGGSLMLIAPPIEYNEIMSKVPKGKLITSEEIRLYLAKKHNADFTCHLTAGIFINICANASEERNFDKIPYWRTLKKDGELNPKFPGGYESQRDFLEKEGHEILNRGKRLFVHDYKNKLWNIEF